MHLFTINQTVNSKYTIKNYKLNKSWKRSSNFFPNINLIPVHWPELSSIHWDCTIITIPTESDKKYINFKSATTSIRKKEFPVQPNLLPYSVKIVTAVFYLCIYPLLLSKEHLQMSALPRGVMVHLVHSAFSPESCWIVNMINAPLR